MTQPDERRERLALSDAESDRIVTWVRAVCGALAGVFVAALIWLKFYELGAVPVILLFVAVPAAFSYGAVRHGDAFWVRWLRNPLW